MKPGAISLRLDSVLPDRPTSARQALGN